MGDTADVLVDGKPVGDFLGIVRRFSVVGIAIAIEIPGGVHKGIHGIGFAAGRTAAFRAGGIDEFGERSQRRAAFSGELGIFGKDDREILVGHGNQAIVWAIHDR